MTPRRKARRARHFNVVLLIAVVGVWLLSGAERETLVALLLLAGGLSELVRVALASSRELKRHQRPKAVLYSTSMILFAFGVIASSDVLFGILAGFAALLFVLSCLPERFFWKRTRWQAT